MKKAAYILVFLASSILVVNAQRPGGAYGGGEMPREGKITGHVIGNDGKPVEYATISLFSKKDSALVSGAITQADGSFELTGLPFGRFYAEFSFVGFDKTNIDDISLRPPNIVVDLGNVKVVPSTESINEVEVVANRPRVEYKLDKKIINVSQDLTSTGGTAIDVLENVPSIQTDIEGNVSLRGSSNFVVYIDGRPSILDGNDALQQIPASAIETIEIITNPSAKYEAEGTAGIINVILKKRKAQGINGIINASVGTNNKYGTDILLNYRADKFNIYGGVDYNVRNYDMSFSSYEKRFLNGVDTLYRTLERDLNRNRKGMGFKLGVDYFINDKTSFSITGEYDDRSGESSTYSNRKDLFLGETTIYDIDAYGDRISHNYEFSFDFSHKFNENGHELRTAYNIEGETGGRDEGVKEFILDLNTNTSTLGTNYLLSDDNPEYEMRFKLDYTNPFSEFGKFETGIQLDADYADYIYEFQQDIGDNRLNTLDSNEIEIDRSVYAAYAMYANRLPWKIDFQAGFRFEYTDRIVKAEENFPVKRPDFFPSLHMSKKIDDHNQIMASYSRRINRPREWALNPLKRYIDSESARSGNAGLEPEYTNSYELNYQYAFDMSFVSLEAYHRKNTNLIHRTNFFDEQDSVLLWTSLNAGESYSTGLEIMSNLVVKKIFILNASYSLYNYKIVTDLETSNEDADREDFSWRARAMATINMPWKGRFQINSFYNGSSITAQGERDGFFVTSLGYRQDLFDRKLSLTVDARDIFGGMNFSGISYLPTSIIESEFRRESKIITFTLSYKINNYKSRDRNAQNGEGGGVDSGGDDMF